MDKETEKRIKTADDALERAQKDLDKRYPNIKEGFRPEDFYSRENILNNTIKIPKSNDKVKIIPPIFDGWGFRVDEFDEEFCDPIPEDVFKQTIRLCNKSVQVSYRKKRKIGRGKKSEWATIFLVIGSISGFCGFFLMEYMINTDTDDIYMALWVAVFFSVSLVIAAIVFVSVFFSKVDNEEKIKDLSKKIDAILEAQNRVIYRDMGFEWSAPKNIFWLQLVKVQEQPEPEVQDFMPEDGEGGEEGPQEGEEDEIDFFGEPDGENGGDGEDGVGPGEGDFEGSVEGDMGPEMEEEELGFNEQSRNRGKNNSKGKSRRG